jgi:transcriptional regulator with XRE-family HTH domain
MPPAMTTDEFRAIRQRLGLSQVALAERLGLGANGARTVQRIEGGAPITGPMALAMQKLDGDRVASAPGR